MLQNLPPICGSEVASSKASASRTSQVIPLSKSSSDTGSLRSPAASQHRSVWPRRPCVVWSVSGGGGGGRKREVFSNDHSIADHAAATELGDRHR